jgi:tetratricopeptide (TPR) repeat protein
MSGAHKSYLAPALPRCLAVACAMALCAFAGRGADPNPSATAPETNAQETLRALLLIQDQLHTTQQAVERNHQDAQAAAARNTDALTSRLQNIEQALDPRRAQTLGANQNSNSAVLIVAGAFVALGFLALLIMAYFQSRTLRRLAEICSGLPSAAPAAAALAANTTQQLPAGLPEQSNQPLLDALEHIENRLNELDHAARSPSQQSAPLTQETTAPFIPSSTNPAAAAESAPATPSPDRIAMLLGKGQSLLGLGHAEAALACFDEVLSLDANHPEALVKKGAALERLQKSDEAIACYDRAIAVDSNMTVAYLYKGGLCNRLERFSEALECYEQALRTQKNGRG